MPTVPRYDEREVTLNPLPGQRQQVAAPAAAFGAQTAKDAEQVGKILGGVADAATEFAIKAKRDADETLVNDIAFEAEQALAAERVKMVDERGQYIGANRQKEVPLSDDYRGRAGTILAERLAKVTDPSQREMLLEKSKRLLARESEWGFELETKTNKEYMVATGTKTVDTALKQIIAADGDLVKIEEGMVNLDSGVRVMAAGNDLLDEVRDQKIAEARGKAAAIVVSALLDNNKPAAANQVFGKYGDMMDVGTKEKLQKAIGETDIEVKAYRYVEDALAKRLPYDQALAGVKGEGKEQDAIRAKLKQRYAEEAHGKAVAQANANNEALALVRDGKPVPRSLLNRMDPKAAIAIGSLYEKKARGEKVKTDPRVYEQVRAKVLEDETFDLTPFVDQLNEGDYQELVRLKQDSGNKQKVAFVKKVDAEIKRRSDSLPEHLRAEYAQWARNELATVLDEDRPIDDSKLKTVLDRGLLRKDGGWSYSSGYVFRGTPGDYVIRNEDGTAAIRDRFNRDTPEGQATQEDLNRYIEESFVVVPQRDESQIRASLKAAGIVADDDLVRAIYLEKKSKQGAKQ